MSENKDPLANVKVSDDVAKKIPNYKEIETAYELMLRGASVGDLLGITPENLETLYALGYSLYNSGKYEDSLKVFRALCLYESTDVRFWLGLGGCQDNLKRYQEAAQAYAMGAVMSGLTDPEPMYYAALCFLKDNKKPEAIEAFEYIEMMGRDGNAHDLDFKDRAKALLNTLKNS